MPDEPRPDDELFIIFLHAVPGKPFTPEIIHAHVAHLQQLEKAGKLVLCGPLTDAPMGIVVIRSSSKAEAESVATADPCVVQGYRTYTVNTWQVAHAGNNYLDAPQ